jgi:hypothetical protein
MVWLSEILDAIGLLRIARRETPAWKLEFFRRKGVDLPF